MKKLETLTFSNCKKRNFPKDKKEIDIKFNETPLYKESIKAEIESKQLKLFKKGK